MEYRAITKDKYISHHGIKGMRWGHRKDGGPQGYLGTYPKGNMKKAGAGGGVSKEYLDELEYNSKQNEYFTNGGGGMTDLDKFREESEREFEDFGKESDRRFEEFKNESERKQKEFQVQNEKDREKFNYDSTKWVNEFIEKSDKAIQDTYKAAAIASTANSMVNLMNGGRALLGPPGVVATIAYEKLKTPLRNISKSVAKSALSNLFNQIGIIVL